MAAAQNKDLSPQQSKDQIKRLEAVIRRSSRAASSQVRAEQAIVSARRTSAPSLELQWVGEKSLPGSVLGRISGLARLKSLSLPPISDTGLARVRNLPSLESLQFAPCRGGSAAMTARGVRALKRFPKLERLEFYDSCLGPRAVAALGEMTALTRLSVTGDPSGFKPGPVPFQKLKALKMLGLRQDGIRDAGLAGLPSSVESLDLSEDPVTPRGLRALARLPRLQMIILSRDHLGARGLAALAAVKSLQVIQADNEAAGFGRGLHFLKGLRRLRQIGLTNDGVKDSELAGLPASIENLSLTGDPITDAGAAALARLKGLRSLNLSGTRVGPAGVAALAPLKRLHCLQIDDPRAAKVLLRSHPHLRIPVVKAGGGITRDCG